MRRFQIYWTCSRLSWQRIVRHFCFDECVSINGHTDVSVADDDLKTFFETARRGFFKIRREYTAAPHTND
jgi:hypothetical protein